MIPERKDNEKYNKEQSEKVLTEDSYMDKGEINNSVKNCIADMSNQFGSGAYSNLDEAMEALKERISQQ